MLVAWLWHFESWCKCSRRHMERLRKNNDFSVTTANKTQEPLRYTRPVCDMQSFLPTIFVNSINLCLIQRAKHSSSFLLMPPCVPLTIIPWKYWGWTMRHRVRSSTTMQSGGQGDFPADHDLGIFKTRNRMNSSKGSGNVPSKRCKRHIACSPWTVMLKSFKCIRHFRHKWLWLEEYFREWYTVCRDLAVLKVTRGGKDAYARSASPSEWQSACRPTAYSPHQHQLHGEGEDLSSGGKRMYTCQSNCTIMNRLPTLQSEILCVAGAPDLKRDVYPMSSHP